MMWLPILTFPVFAFALPSLPLSPVFVPRNLWPPLAHGRRSVHGWLLLPTEPPSGNPLELAGYFVHHTPEFFLASPHNFEVLVKGTLTLNQSVHGLPLPPQLVGTEYVLSPPAFSLDELLTGQLTTIVGAFSNGSFDTPQRYVIAEGSLAFDIVTARYLSANATRRFDFLAYMSFPVNSQFSARSSKALDLYMMHVLQASPDFDQVLRVAVDLAACRFRNGDSWRDAIEPSATWVVERSNNTVWTRLRAGDRVDLALMTARAKNVTANASSCRGVGVLEEIHCVVVPDSFTNCP